MRCSPPESVPASCRGARRAAGTARTPRRARARTPARPRLRRNVSSRFSSTVSDANTERPSGACTMPEPGVLIRRPAGDVLARRSSTWPAVGAIEPRAHARDRRLARAVRAEQREHAAGRRPRATRRRSRGTGRSRRRRRAARAAVRPAPGVGRRRRPSDDVSEVGLAHRVVGEHRLGRARRDQRAEVEHEHALDEGCGRARRRARRAGSRCRARGARCSSVCRELGGLVRGRDPTTARRAAAAWARSSAPGRSRPAGRRRGSATRPGGRRPRRGRAGRASPARAPALVAGRAAAVQQVLPQRAAPAADAVGDEEVLAGRHARRTARCVGTCARCRAGPGRASARASRSWPSKRIRAAVGLEDAEQAVEERRLARAVGPDEARPARPRRRRG